MYSYNRKFLFAIIFTLRFWHFLFIVFNEKYCWWVSTQFSYGAEWEWTDLVLLLSYLVTNKVLKNSNQEEQFPSTRCHHQISWQTRWNRRANHGANQAWYVQILIILKYVPGQFHSIRCRHQILWQTRHYRRASHDANQTRWAQILKILKYVPKQFHSALCRHRILWQTRCYRRASNCANQTWWAHTLTILKYVLEHFYSTRCLRTRLRCLIFFMVAFRMITVIMSFFK